MDEEIWVPLVDEPIGELVAKIQADDPEIEALVASPRRQLSFLTFAYIRVGLVLGQLLIDTDVEPEGSRTWVEELLDDPKTYEALVEEVRAVAREVAADPKLAEEEPGPGVEARERFRNFARRSLDG
jgi:hypothetical protein